MKKSEKQIDELLTRRVAKILPSRSALEKLLKAKKIRLYQGIDPTYSKLHLGHTVGLRKLMEFANAGHEVIFLFGTGTVLVGDPSLRDTGRKLITQKEIDENIKSWKDQVKPIVDFSKIKIKQNGDWLPQLNLKNIINIASNISAIQLFKRKSFTRRIKKGDTVWYHETMYPLLQGYDSVVMDVDLEIGGTDQEFNMLVGRELQKKMNNREKIVLTVPMIPGTDGKQMSKTVGNCVWLDDPPKDMFGKLMKVPDELITSYMELVTDISLKRIRQIKQGLKKERIHPMEAKKELAFAVTAQLHSQQKAEKAREEFEKTIQKKQMPADIPTLTISLKQESLFKICKSVRMEEAKINIKQTESNGQIKRTIEQGGVSYNNQKITNPNHLIKIKDGDVLKYGKFYIRKLKLRK